MALRKENYKDMEKYRQTRNAQRKRYYDKTAFKYGLRRWTDEEDVLVAAHEMTDMELSYKIKRSVAAIQQRRSRLNKKG